MATRPAARPPRPVYLNLLAIRQPWPAIVSILHRISGLLLFLVGTPLALWGLDASLRSPEAYAQFATAMSHPLAKLVALALLWSTVHHVLAGVRHLLMDVHVGVDLPSARRSSVVVLVLGVVVTAAIALRLA
jgi:succinate dehydrogenase / fumarate reductase cytochrome b subunit